MCLCVHLFVVYSVCLSVCLFVCLFICLSGHCRSNQSVLLKAFEAWPNTLHCGKIPKSTCLCRCLLLCVCMCVCARACVCVCQHLCCLCRQRQERKMNPYHKPHLDSKHKCLCTQSNRSLMRRLLKPTGDDSSQICIYFVQSLLVMVLCSYRSCILFCLSFRVGRCSLIVFHSEFLISNVTVLFFNLFGYIPVVVVVDCTILYVIHLFLFPVGTINNLML